MIFDRDFEKPWRENERLARIDKQYKSETRSMERLAQVSGDSPAAGASAAHSGELTTMSGIQKAERHKLSSGGLKRDAQGHIYPPAGFEVLK